MRVACGGVRAAAYGRCKGVRLFLSKCVGVQVSDCLREREKERERERERERAREKEKEKEREREREREN